MHRRWVSPGAGPRSGRPAPPGWAGERAAHRPGHRFGSLRRATGDALLGGVAAGLARRIHKDVTVVRVVFLVAGLTGIGILPYFVCWLLIPADGEEGTILSRAVGDRRTMALAAAVASVVGLGLVATSSLGIGWFGSF